MTQVEVVLTAVSEDLAEAWRTFCGALPGVTIHDGSILDVDCDAVVSPANSFGFMDGGIDAVYLRRFGPQLQAAAQALIQERYGGELLVGQADLLPTGDAKVPFVILAPTMRVPTILRDSVNPYLAARAVLRLVLDGTHGDGTDRVAVSTLVRRVAFPGLGTGVGQLSAAACAHQVGCAIRDVLVAPPTFPRTWAEASERHLALFDGRPRRLQHEQS